MPAGPIVLSHTTLTLTVQGTDYSCQVVKATMTPPGRADGETVVAGCGGVVSLPGAVVPGTLVLEILGEYEGVTLALLYASTLATTVSFSVEYAAGPGDLSGEQKLTFTGTATVRPFAVDWSVPGTARHTVTLTIRDIAITTPDGATVRFTDALTGSTPPAADTEPEAEPEAEPVPA